jgi:type II secretory pathway pseudopilin PulG
MEDRVRHPAGPSSPKPSYRHLAAFTLIELLVVIGIIALLIGILIPVVTKVRTSANVANTQQNISSLVSAIERYYADFRAYPGVFANDQIGTTPIYLNTTLPLVPLAPASVPQGVNKITTSENLVLALCGGLHYDRAAAPKTFTYDPDRVGTGPESLGVATKTFASYIETANRVSTGKLDGMDDTVIPEFLDGFGSDQMPIIYLRARTGATGIVGTTNLEQYNAEHGRQYTFRFDWTHPAPISPGSPDGDDPNPDPDFLTAADYFTSPTVPGTARQKDTFILIAAGKDRKFGTKDDLTNFGGF